MAEIEGERIYVRNESGLVSLKEERFESEDALQVLLAQHPELLDGEQMRPGDARRWILITREQGIADREGAPARWSLDHLVIDQDATPTLVEVKRGADSRVRREVVGQMLDYAAHAPQVWTVDELRKTFEERGDHKSALAELLKDNDEEPDADEFWQRVATNLVAKRLRLLFVADAIPDELAQVVEFLNEQMPTIEVLAVEIKQFRGEMLQTLVPRVIGRLAKSSTGSDAELKEAQRLYREFWQEFLPEFEKVHTDWGIHRSSKGARRLTNGYLAFDACGKALSEMHYSFDYARRIGDPTQVNFWVETDDAERIFSELFSRKDEIEGHFSDTVKWGQGPKKWGIHVLHPDLQIAVEDRERWPDVRDWAIERLGALRAAIQPHLDNL